MWRKMVILCWLLVPGACPVAAAESRAVDVVPVLQAGQGQARAVLVGVNDYERLKDLNFCEADVTALRDRLVEIGFDRRSVKCLTTADPDPSLRPSFRNITEQLDVMFAGLDSDSVLVIALAGHGGSFEWQDASGEPHKESFFCPQDARLTDPQGTMISQQKIFARLDDQRCPARFKLLLTDACRDPHYVPPETPVGGRTAVDEARSMAGFGDSVRSLADARQLPKGTLALISCSSGEQSWEDRSLGHGIFMHYVLEALSGKADREYRGDKNDVVCYREFRDYVYRKTSDHVWQSHGGEPQTPTFYANWELPNFDLVRLPRPAGESLAALFTVREEDQNGRLLSGAEVELYYRESESSRLETLGSGRSDAGGTAQIPVTLTLAQQARGSYGVTVRLGAASRSYPLDHFPQTRSFALYVPRAVPPSPSPKPAPPGVKPGVTLETSIGMKLVLIPAGEFQMGSPAGDTEADVDEKLQHLVRITQPFYLGVTEVTQGQYEGLMGTNPSNSKGADLPVEWVSWEEAVEFCRKLSEKEGRQYRLPTEAEWEYACRAGSRTKWSSGDVESSLGEYAWYGENSDSTTHPVGEMKPNAWGLYDMHGNVWEWCSDGYGPYDGGAVVSDPTGAVGASDRVYRGGGWNFSAAGCRSAFRFYGTPGLQSSSLGFRVASSSVDASK